VAVFRQDASWLILGAMIPAASGLGPRNTLTGTALISFTGKNSDATTVVNFGLAFPVAPVVTANIDSGAGPTARWVPRPISITTTGFTMFVFHASDATTTFTWASVPVSWTATARS
jgi:hypothetical protein